jgi:hypothetical protein
MLCVHLTEPSDSPIAGKSIISVRVLLEESGFWMGKDHLMLRA